MQYVINPPPHKTKERKMKLGDNSFPIFSWKIHLKRILTPYILGTFIPTTTLVATSWISFLIPPESVPGRAGLLVTLLLVLTTFHLHELDVSPSVKGITPLLIWSEICLSLIILAFLEYAVILYFMRFGKKKIGSKQMLELSTISKEKQNILTRARMRNKGVDYILEPNESKSNKVDSIDTLEVKGVSGYRERALRIDHYALKTFPPLFVIIISIYWTYCCSLY